MIILAGILNILIPLVLLVQVVVSLLLVFVVLMQRPKQEGLGAAFGAGMTDQMFGAQTTNVLQKATVWFGIIFFSTTLLLAVLYNKQNTSKVIATEEIEKVEDATTTEKKELSLAEQLSQVEEVATEAAKDAQKNATETVEKVEAQIDAKANDAVQNAVEAVKEKAAE